jgi:hypothetical protein
MTTFPMARDNFFADLSSFQIVMYIMNYIDRNALPQARIQGIEKDIGLVGIEYNIVLSLTFIGYILMQGTSGYYIRIGRWQDG